MYTDEHFDAAKLRRGFCTLVLSLLKFATSGGLEVCWNARAIQRISDPEAMVFIVAARLLYILSMGITTCATTLQ